MFWRRHCFCFHRVSETPAHQSRRVIFLIRDRGPTRKTRAFVENLNGSLRLFYLPPSPDRNPDALGRKHWKAGAVGRIAITGACGAVGAQSKLDSRLGNLP
jgi:hypothetical protein